jgi:hypothetical protein
MNGLDTDTGRGQTDGRSNHTMSLYFQQTKIDASQIFVCPDAICKEPACLKAVAQITLCSMSNTVHAAYKHRCNKRLSETVTLPGDTSALPSVLFRSKQESS